MVEEKERISELEELVGAYQQKILMMRGAAIEADMRYLEKILSDLRHAAGIISPEGRIQYANPPLLKLLGESEQVIGKDYYVFLRGDPKTIQDYFNNVRKQNELVFVMNRKGKYRKFELRKIPLFTRKPFRVDKEHEHLCTVFHLYSLWWEKAESDSLEEKLTEEKKTIRTPKQIISEANAIADAHLNAEKSNS